MGVQIFRNIWTRGPNISKYLDQGSKYFEISGPGGPFLGGAKFSMTEQFVFPGFRLPQILDPGFVDLEFQA